MNKIKTILFLLVVFSITCNAQKKYSVTNLEQSSQEELNAYLDKAINLRQTGKTLTIIGGVTTGVAGLYLISGKGGLGEFAIASLSGLGGLSLMTGGIIMRTTNSKRIERINEIMKPASASLRIYLIPDIQYNSFTQNYFPGVGIRMTF